MELLKGTGDTGANMSNTHGIKIKETMYTGIFLTSSKIRNTLSLLLMLIISSSLTALTKNDFSIHRETMDFSSALNRVTRKLMLIRRLFIRWLNPRKI